jgi:predicted ester cyclase
MSTAEEASNKATVRRFDDVVSTGDAEVISKTIDELVEPDVLIRIPLPIQATGAQALKQVWAMLLRGLPDLHVAVEDVIAEGDKVVSRNTVTGTYQGEYRGLPPTGKPITYKRDLHLPLRQRANRGDLGGRRRLLADATARRDSRLANLTGSAQEDRQGRKPTSDP